MVVIYDQEKTHIFNDLAGARSAIMLLYGDKLGKEACETIRKGRPGTVYRRYGGPRIEVVTDAEAEWIRGKEAAAGMLA